MRDLEAHQVGRMLTTIASIGHCPPLASSPNSTTRPASTLLAHSQVMCIALRLRQSGKRQFAKAGMIPLGSAGLRRARWMPTLSATAATS